MQVKECKKMQSYKTSQVGGRTSQVGGITCKEKNYRTVRDGGNPTKVAVATNNIMQVVNLILKLLVIESKIEYLQ